jgi:hypothetical protein
MRPPTAPTGIYSADLIDWGLAPSSFPGDPGATPGSDVDGKTKGTRDPQQSWRTFTPTTRAALLGGGRPTSRSRGRGAGRGRGRLRLSLTPGVAVTSKRKGSATGSQPIPDRALLRPASHARQGRASPSPEDRAPQPLPDRPRPPPRPAAGRRRHGFPGSHGPPEQTLRHQG